MAEGVVAVLTVSDTMMKGEYCITLLASEYASQLGKCLGGEFRHLR